MASHAQDLANSPPPVPANHPLVTDKDIKDYFDKQSIPSTLEKIETEHEIYIFVKAHPYSGLDITDLYCFVKRHDRWAMFLRASLWKTPFDKDIAFKEDGSFIDVSCKGAVVLKINPPKF